MHKLCTASPQVTVWLKVPVIHSSGEAAPPRPPVRATATAPSPTARPPAPPRNSTPTAQRPQLRRRANFDGLEWSPAELRQTGGPRRLRWQATAGPPGGPSADTAQTLHAGPAQVPHASTAQAPRAGTAHAPSAGGSRYVGTPSKFTSCAAAPRRAAAQQRASVQHCWKSSSPTTLETPGP